MSFFTLSTGKALETTGTMEMGGGDIAPIPKNTNVLAMCDEAKWDEYQDDKYISLRWTIMQPAEYANRKIFQKIKILESDVTKRDKAMAMLGAIDTNAGGHLQAAGVQPTDQSLIAALANKPMVLQLQVWEMNDKKGNWVSKVAPRSQNTAQQAPPPVAAPAAPAHPANNFDDDIPFANPLRGRIGLLI